MDEVTLAWVEWNVTINRAWIVVGNKDHLHEFMYIYESCMLSTAMAWGKGQRSALFSRFR